METKLKQIIFKGSSEINLLLKQGADAGDSDWNSLYRRIGNNIRTLRTFFKYTQEYMAAELNISCSAYGKIERNENEFSVKRLFQIAAVLGVSIELLIYLDANEIKIDNRGD